MKLYKYIMALALPALAFTSCSDDDSWDNSGVRYSQMVICRSQSIAEMATVNPAATPSVTLSFNNLVAVTDGSIDLNGAPVSASAKGMDLEILLPALTPYTEYTLTIPVGAIAVKDKAEIKNTEAIVINFNTNFGVNPVNVASQLVNANASAEAKAVYSYLRNNYTKTMLTGAMGGVGWETDYSDLIASEIGKYPAVVGFDYIHLASSPSNWIDYGDISPVKRVWDGGSLVEIQWHWNVPTAAPGEVSPSADIKAVLWEGVTSMPADWSSFILLTDQAALDVFASAAVGDVIEVETKDVNAGAQGSFKNSGWSQIAPGTEYFDITGNFSLTITSDILSSLQSGGLIVSGHDYTATRVTLKGAAATKAASRAQELSFRADGNDFNAANVLVDGTWENEVAKADIAKLAGYLQLLKDANIPVLWRPFHEAAGDYTWGAWFWWGAQGTDVTKQLYIYLYDQLTNVYGLNNLIWVWTVQTSDAGMPASEEKMKAAYPGDQYVDIVGTDLYPAAQLTDQTDQFNMVNSVVDSKKMVALTECGNLIDPAAAAASGALWSYYMQWYDLNGSFGHYNYPGEQWITVCDHSSVVCAPVNIR